MPLRPDENNAENNGTAPPEPTAASAPAEPHRLWIERPQAGARVEDLLGATWPRVSNSAWREALRAGQILLSGSNVHPQQRVAEGDVLELLIDPDALPARADGRARGLPVLYEDAAVLIVDKPSGLLTVPDRTGARQGLWGQLDALRPGADLRIVHRLDAGTSGCLALAKGLDAARALDAAFRAGSVHKEYLALVDGVVAQDFSSRRALGPDRRHPGRVAVVDADAKGARAAHTDFVVEERFRRHTLLRAMPRTGRSHQIRVHLRAAHHSVAGDTEYGASEPLRLSDLKRSYKRRRGVAEPALLRRMFLHAAVLELPSPAAGVARAQAPLPVELEMVLNKLRRFTGEPEIRCD